MGLRSVLEVGVEGYLVVDTFEIMREYDVSLLLSYFNNNYKIYFS